jgi:hypothetical protein
MSNPNLHAIPEHHEALHNKTRLPLTWDEYVHSLPEWVSTLITNTARSARAKTELYEALLNESETLCIVSDGGQKDEYGSFGWVIGTKDEILFEGSGPARGQPMTSHRSEAYGKLAWMCFVLHYTEFLGIEIKCAINSYCDNIAIIRGTKFNKEKTAFNSLQADYDILAQIADQQTRLRRIAPRLAQSRHVKGHQDKLQPIHELTRQAQLNIRADQLATQALNEIIWEKSNPQMIALPSCSIYLLNAGMIQSSQEKKSLRWKWSDFRLQNYYCKRLQLPPSVLHRINWESYQIARRRLSSAEQAFSTKAITRWLPTSHQTKKYGAILAECHVCGEDETVDHLFLCPGNIQWKREFLERLAIYLAKIETAADIKSAMLAGFARWLDRDLPTPVKLRSHNGDTCRASQNETGWNLAMLGLLDESWSMFQDEYFNQTGTRKIDQSGKIWNTKLSGWLIREARNRWTARNNEVHKDDDGKSKIEQETLEQVRNLYKLADDMSYHDKSMFDVPLEQRLQLPTNTLRQWIKNTIPTANRCIRDLRDKIGSRQHDIRKFFQKIQTNNTRIQERTNTQNHYDNLSR